MTPDALQQQYGITGSYTGSIQTPDGTLRGTIVPVTLADGRGAQLIIPGHTRNETHTMYVRDADGFHPVQLQDNVTREQLVQTSQPVVVGRRTEVVHRNKHGWEKDALIIGGGAGGGALVGALAGGKKGAGIVVLIRRWRGDKKTPPTDEKKGDGKRDELDDRLDEELRDLDG